MESEYTMMTQRFLSLVMSKDYYQSSGIDELYKGHT
jgi:spore coat protein CotF